MHTDIRLLVMAWAFTTHNALFTDYCSYLSLHSYSNKFKRKAHHFNKLRSPAAAKCKILTYCLHSLIRQLAPSARLSHVTVLTNNSPLHFISHIECHHVFASIHSNQFIQLHMYIEYPSCYSCNSRVLAFPATQLLGPPSVGKCNMSPAN